MVTDLPDYEKKVVVVTIPGDYPAEIQIDHIKILGTALKTPTFAQCVPSSIENDALAYDPVTDKFYVWAYGNLDKLQQRASTLELLVWVNNFPADFPDASSLAKLDLILAQLDSKTSTLFKAGQNIGNAFALESGGNLAAILAQLDSKTSTLFKAGQAIGALPAGTNNIGDVDVLTLPSIPAGTNNIGDVDVLTLPALPSGTNEIGSIKVSKQDATATAVQISIAALNGNSSALHTPASGKAIRLKFISIAHSADVDIGYRFGAAGTIYYMRITKGVYVSNLIGCNNQGAADAALYLNSSGATDVKGYCLVEEV